MVCLNKRLEILSNKIVSCNKCPRLISYIRKVSSEKKPQFKDWDYWGKPLPGFGDPYAKLLVVGLAPAAHGGLRCGRMFTGDSAGRWLIRALYEVGMANKPTSDNANDGLKLKGVYLTAAVRCAPPKNKPTSEEIKNCSDYLKEELTVLNNLKVVMTLGRIAFDAYLRVISRTYGKPKPHLKFNHGLAYNMELGPPYLLVSYHPSRQNTQTGKLTWNMWISVFKKAKAILDSI